MARMGRERSSIRAFVTAFAILAACEDGKASVAPLVLDKDGGPSGTGSSDAGVDGDAGEQDGGTDILSLDPTVVHHFGWIVSGPGYAEMEWALGRFDRPNQGWGPIPAPPDTKLVGLRGGDGAPVFVTTDDSSQPSETRLQFVARASTPVAGNTRPQVTNEVIQTLCVVNRNGSEIFLSPDSNLIVYACVTGVPRTVTYYSDDGATFPVPEGYTLRHLGVDGSLLLSQEDAAFIMLGDGTIVPIVNSAGTPIPLIGFSIIRATPDGFWVASDDRWLFSFDGQATLEGTFQPLKQRAMGRLELMFRELCKLSSEGDLYCFAQFICCDSSTQQAEEIVKLTLTAEGAIVHEEANFSIVNGSMDIFPKPRIQLSAGSELVTGH